MKRYVRVLLPLVMLGSGLVLVFYAGDRIGETSVQAVQLVDVAGSVDHNAQMFSSIAAAAPANQREALSDGHVSRDEYVAAVDREVSCFRQGAAKLAVAEAKLTIFSAKWSAGNYKLEWTYRIEGMRESADQAVAPLPGLAKRCAIESSAAIVDAWVAERIPTEAERAELIKSFRTCLQGSGSDIDDSAPLSVLIELAASDRLGGEKCLSDHELLSFGPPSSARPR